MTSGSVPTLPGSNESINGPEVPCVIPMAKRKGFLTTHISLISIRIIVFTEAK
jgi:hypothetical protein